MMPMRVRRKAREMEKVENLYRTARAQHDSMQHIRTTRITLARALRAMADVARFLRGAPQFTSTYSIATAREPRGRPVDAATARASSGAVHAAASRLIVVVAEAAASSSQR